MQKKGNFRSFVFGLIILSILLSVLVYAQEVKRVASASENYQEKTVTVDVITEIKNEEISTPVENVLSNQDEITSNTIADTKEEDYYDNDITDLNEQYKKVEELSNNVASRYISLYKRLLLNGKTYMEAEDIINEEFSAEFKRIYGEELLIRVYVSTC